MKTTGKGRNKSLKHLLGAGHGNSAATFKVDSSRLRLRYRLALCLFVAFNLMPVVALLTAASIAQQAYLKASKHR